MRGAVESGPTRSGEAHAVADLLRRSRFEVLPLEGVEDQVLTHLDRDVTITVTASPSRGLDPTLELSERLMRAGYTVVPHVSARLVRDESHLNELLDRALAAGIRASSSRRDAAAPAGPSSAADLRRQWARAAPSSRRSNTGYPESTPDPRRGDNPGDVAKAPMARNHQSDLFDAGTIVRWIVRSAAAARTSRSG